MAIGFYLLYKSIMKFNNWDIVISKNNTGKSIEAVVDFEKEDWTVYISEWWKNLSSPIRYIVRRDNLLKKEWKKICISLMEMNMLMDIVLGMKNCNYSIEPNLDNMEIWMTLQDEYRSYKYVWKLEGEAVREYDWYFCTIDKEDLKRLVRTRDDVCQKIFWVASKFVEVK